MSRPLRTIKQDVTYHCYSLCHNRENFLSTKTAKQFFIEAVQMCQEKYTFELIAAEIVANHIHLVIRTLKDAETISRIMQYIKARIGEKYNKHFKKGGAFWIGRFGCKIIEESDDPKDYLLNLLWYVAYNPVRKELCTDPRKSEIGFINCYLVEGHKLEIKITLHPFFYKLGSTFSECVKKFLVYEEVQLKKIVVSS
jgi:REP element-mobilizing transposase RayT